MAPGAAAGRGEFRGRETEASSLIATGGVWPGAVRTAGRVRRLGRLIALSCFASSHLAVSRPLRASIPDAYAPWRALRAVACLLGDGCTIPRRAALCSPLKTPDRAAALTGQCAGALAGVRAGGVLRARVLHSQNGQPCLSKKRGRPGQGRGRWAWQWAAVVHGPSCAALRLHGVAPIPRQPGRAADQEQTRPKLIIQNGCIVLQQCTPNKVYKALIRL